MGPDMGLGGVPLVLGGSGQLRSLFLCDVTADDFARSWLWVTLCRHHKSIWLTSQSKNSHSEFESMTLELWRQTMVLETSKCAAKLMLILCNPSMFAAAVGHP